MIRAAGFHQPRGGSDGGARLSAAESTATTDRLTNPRNQCHVNNRISEPCGADSFFYAPLPFPPSWSWRGARAEATARGLVGEASGEGGREMAGGGGAGRKVSVAAVQFACTDVESENVDTAERYVVRYP